MAGAIRVFALAQELREVDGVTIVRLTMEVLDDFTAVRFYCPRNARTRALDEEHERHMQEFIEGFHRGDRTPPPDAPAHTLLAGNGFPGSIRLDDGCGTEFSLHSGQTGSPGEWLFDARFRGVPAPEAHHLMVSVAIPGGTKLSARIALQG